MIFKTIYNDATGAAKGISIFNSTLHTMKRNIKSGQGIIYSIFSGDKLKQNDVRSITNFANALKNGVSTSKAWCENMTNCSVAAKQYTRNALLAGQSADDLTKGLKSTTIAAKANTVAMKGLAIAGNVLASIGLTLVISKALSFINEMISANEDLLNSAKELSSEFKETESSINGYKERIKELYETINDSSSSINDVTEARKDLMEVQDELIQKFGTEKDTIDIITQAINGQADALDYLSQKKYQEWKNELNNKTFGQFAVDFFSSDNISNALLKLTQLDFQGTWDSFTAPTESNIDKMVSSMQHGYYEIEKTGNQTFDELIEKTYDLVDLGDKFEISGNLNDIYEDIIEIQEMSKDFEVSDKFESSATNAANAMDDSLKSFKDAYNTYILYEKILDGSKNTGYDKQFDLINKAKESYNDAVTSGNEDSIKKAGETYAETLQSAISSALGNSDNDVADYFRLMYPEMQQIFGEWSFELNFEPNTDGLKDKVIDALDKIDGESDGITSFSSEDILNFNPNVAAQEQIDAYGELKRVAEEYGLTVENLIALLQKMGLVKSDSYQQLVEKFGQELVDTLSDEDLQFAFTVSRDSIESWDELIEKINEAKEKAAKEDEITDISGVVSKLDEDAIKNYNDRLASLKSYLDKFNSGEFSSSDISSLTEEFGIAGGSIDELTEKIQKLMDSEMDSIIAQIDNILNTENLSEETKKQVENLKQSIIDTNKEAKGLGESLSLKMGTPLENVQSLSQGLDQLDKIYADILDKEDFDWSSILNNADFKNTFGAFTEEYENFINTVSKSPDDINACQDAFNKLAGAYIRGAGALDEVTESTKAGTIAMLEQMGVANAEQVVTDALARAKLRAKEAEILEKIAKDGLKDSSLSLADAMREEISVYGLSESAINSLSDAYAQAQQYMTSALNNGAKARLEKLGLEISAVQSYADALGMLKKQNGGFVDNWQKDAGGYYGDSQWIGDILNYSRALDKARSSIDNAINTVPTINYTGGTATRDTQEKLAREAEKAAKDAEKAAKDANKEAEVTEEHIDGIEIKLNNLTEAASKAAGRIDEMLSFGEKKKQTQKAIEETTKAIEAEYRAMKKYAEYAERFSADAAKETTETVTETVANSVSGSLPELASSTASDVVAEAMKYVGKLPYVSGGESLVNGADCSGFVQSIFKKFGVSIGRTTWDQYPQGTAVDKQNLQPGDLVFFGTPGNPTHVGLYAGSGQFIDEPRSGLTASVHQLSTRTNYIGARRYEGISGSELYKAASSPSSSASYTTKTYTKVVPGIDSETLAKYQRLVREGSFDIETITNEKLKNAIKSYQEWYDKMKACRDKIDELNNDLRELYRTMAQIPIDKRDGNVETLDTRIDILNSKRDNLSAVIVNKDKYRSTQKDVKRARSGVRKSLRTKAQRAASGLSKTEIDEIGRLMKSGKSIPAKMLDKITDSALYERCRTYNDTVYEHSRYAESASAAGNPARKYNELTNQILKAEKSKTKQYRTAYDSISNTYGKSLDKVTSKGNKLKKSFRKNKYGLSDANMRRLDSCIKNRKQIPTDIMTELESESTSIYDACVKYNNAVFENEGFKEKLDGARFDLQKQQQAETAARQEKKIEKHQRVADLTSAKIDLNEMRAENAESPKKKNKYLKDNVSLIKREYGQLIKIARIQNDLAEAARLELEMQEKLSETFEQRYQNVSDYYSKKREGISRDTEVLDAKGSNALTVSAKNKNLRQQTKQAAKEYKTYKQEYRDTAALFNEGRHSANRSVKKSKNLSKTLKNKIIKLVKAKKEIPGSILDKVRKLDKNAYCKLDEYNDSLDWLDEAAADMKVSRQNEIRTKRENKIQEHQNIADRAQSKIDRNDALRENETTAKGKNKYLKEDNRLLDTQYKHLIETAKLNKDNVEAARLEAEWRKKTNDNIKQQYRNLADDHSAKMDYYQLLEDNSASASDKNENEKHRRSQMKYYYLNMRKASFDDPQEQARLDEELQSKIAESYKTVFDNVRNEYEQTVSLISNDISDLDNEMKKTEAAGRLVDASYYSHKISLENESLEKLKEEESSLKEQLKNIQMHSSAWYECQDAVQSVQNAQAESLAAVKEYKDAINDIANTIQNDIAGAFHDITDEAELLITLLGDNLSDSDIGGLTEDGLAALSLYVSQMNVCQDAAESFHNEIKSMQDALANNTLSFIDANGIQRDYASIFELKEHIKDFYSSYQDEIRHVYDYESKIVDMMKQKYQSELDYLKILIDQKEKALDLEKDLYDYSKNIQKQTDNINSLRKQIAVLNGDTSNETKARMQKLQSQLRDAEEELKDAEYDRYITDQKDMLENLYDEYSKLVSDLEKNRDKLLQDGLDLFAQTGADVQDVIKSTAEDHQYEMTDEMEKIIGSIEGMGRMDSYIGADGIITRSLNDIVTEIHSAYTALSSDLNGLRDSSAETGHTGSYSTYGTGSGSADSGQPSSASGSSDSSGGANGQDFESRIERLLRSGTNKYDPNTASSLNRYIYSRYGSALTVDEMAELSKCLGFNYTAKQLSIDDGSHKKRKMKILEELKVHGFSKGGIVPDNALKLKDLGMGRASNGDTVIGTLKPKESVFNEKQTKMIQEYVNKGPDLNSIKNIVPIMDKMMKIPEAEKKDIPTQNIMQVGDVSFNLPNVQNYADLMNHAKKDPDFEKMIACIIKHQLGFGSYLKKTNVTFRH